MHWLWILAIMLFLLLLLLLTRVGIRAEWRSGTLLLDAKIGIFRIGILPRKQKEKQKEKPKADKKEKKSAEKTVPKPTFADIKAAFRDLAPHIKRALRRTRRGIRITPLRISVTLGGQEDPAAAAERYGKLQAAVWTVMPQAEELLDIPDPRIHIGIDFESDETSAEAEAGISIRIGTLLSVAFGVGIPALRRFLRYQKEHSTVSPSKADVT